MQTGDIVATTSQGALYLGIITGPPERVRSDDDLSNLRRAVAWAPEGIDYGALPGEIKGRFSIQYDVVEMTQQMDLLEAMLVEQSRDSSTPDDPTPPRPIVRPLVPGPRKDPSVERVTCENVGV